MKVLIHLREVQFYSYYMLINFVLVYLNFRTFIKLWAVWSRFDKRRKYVFVLGMGLNFFFRIIVYFYTC